MKIQFRKIRLQGKSRQHLDIVNGIIEEYNKAGLVLTLRQLYYQLVSRDVIPNTEKEYKRLSSLLKEGRMGGLVDWEAIEDRIRRPRSAPHWTGPKDFMDNTVPQFALDRQEGQANYVEVWVEKDALSGVLSRVTTPLHIPIMVNRGYSSASAMFDAHERFQTAFYRRQTIRVIYLGDFDPSGRDMIRDVEERICEFFIGQKGGFDIASHSDDTVYDARNWRDFALDHYGYDFQIIPIALTKKQIRSHKPPPNPAKITDPRAKAYIKEHGKSSWEVDALNPQILDRILRENIERLVDMDLYKKIVRREGRQRSKLHAIGKNLKK